MQKRKTAAKAAPKAKTRKTAAKKKPAALKKAVKKTSPKKSTAKKSITKKSPAKRKSKAKNSAALLSPNIRVKIFSLLTQLEELMDKAEKKVMKKLS